MPISAACCPCGQLVGCVCSGVACATVCERKAGTATLCGFPEFLPSSPPRFYKRRRTTGTMTVDRFSVAGCPATFPKNYSGSGTLVTSCGTFSGSFGFFPIGAGVGSTIRYQFSASGTGAGGTPNRVIITGSGIFWQDGQTIDLAPGGVYQVIGVVWCPTNGGWLGANMTPAYPDNQVLVGSTKVSTVDTWDVDEDYRPSLPAVCAPTDTDHSTELVDGAGVSWPYGSVNPPTAYGGYVNVTTHVLDRTSDGNTVCSGPDAFGHYFKPTGSVAESLTIEDTPDDAIARAVGAAAWSPCVFGCQSGCTSFESVRGSGDTVFGFAIVRTRVTWTAVIGTVYHITVRFAARVLGTSGPFLFHSLVETTVAADMVSEVSPWFDVPREAGLEIVVSNCAIEVVP